MSFLKNLLVQQEKELDMEEFLNNLDVEEEVVEDADAFVKPLNLTSDEDVTMVVNEAKAGNLVLLNISDLSKRNILKLKDLIGQVKDEIHAINGDIARISQERVLVTPSRVKIVKKRN